MYLKERFKFNPSFITMDFCKAEIKAAKKIFDKANIILCFFHYIQRLIKHLKEINSKKNSIKEEAKNLLANLKLIVFLPEKEINGFFNKKKKKYKNKFNHFLKYYERSFFNTIPYKDNLWCYYKIRNSLDNEIYFFTNNISESTNRTLNINYVGGCHSFFNFLKALSDLINIFENKETYDENKLSITRAINYYISKIKDFNLITDEKIKDIMKDYENYLLKEKIPFKELPDLDNFNYEIKKVDINFDNLQSDNYITDSSDSDEENNIIDNKFNIENKDNRSDGDDGSDNDDKKNDSNRNNHIKNENNKRPKSKKK